jgi:hypothetical protein
MKTLLRKTNNRVFDNLLRSHIRRPGESASACPEFDPDRASAYIERGLAGVERARYERHLSDCAGCRTSVVALARMADADSITSPVPDVARDSGLRESGWLASLKTGLWGVASPRWAIVATALVVISISIPLLVRRSGEPRIAQDKQVAQAESPLTAEPAAEISSQEPGSAPAATANGNTQPVAAFSRQGERETRRSIATDALKKDAGEPTTSLVAENRAAAEAPERKKNPLGDLAAARDDAKLKETNEKVTASAAAPASPQAGAEESRAKISKDTALKLPSEDTRSARVETLKPGAVDAGPKTEREKDAIAAIRSNDGGAPKHKATLEGEPRAGLTSGARSRSLVGGESARPDRSHSPEKRVGKKSFWLTRGIWTDSEYNSDRKLPVVTVVRDSDVYKELLEKTNKLKAFFKAFGETDSAIIVFKNTVYNLIPQSDNK